MPKLLAACLWLLADMSVAVLSEQVVDAMEQSSGPAFLVAPFGITDTSYESVIFLNNNSSKAERIRIAFNSLLGEEVGSKELHIEARGSSSLSLDTLYSPGHHFGTVGSIIIYAGTELQDTAGFLTISQRGTRKPLLREVFQPSLAFVQSTLRARVAGTFSSPILAVHSLSTMPQRIGIRCLDQGGEVGISYFELPPRMTILFSACVPDAIRKPRYDDVLSGRVSGSPNDKFVDLTVGTPGSVAVWGFSSRQNPLEFFGIEFR
jgi:hypothetical protein